MEFGVSRAFQFFLKIYRHKPKYILEDGTRSRFFYLSDLDTAYHLSKKDLGPKAKDFLSLDHVKMDILYPPLTLKKTKKIRQWVNSIGEDLSSTQNWDPFWSKLQTQHNLSLEKLSILQQDILKAYQFKVIALLEPIDTNLLLYQHSQKMLYSVIDQLKTGAPETAYQNIIQKVQNKIVSTHAKSYYKAPFSQKASFCQNNASHYEFALLGTPKAQKFLEKGAAQKFPALKITQRAHKKLNQGHPFSYSKLFKQSPFDGTSAQSKIQVFHLIHQTLDFIETSFPQSAYQFTYQLQYKRSLHRFFEKADAQIAHKFIIEMDKKHLPQALERQWIHHCTAFLSRHVLDPSPFFSKNQLSELRPIYAKYLHEKVSQCPRKQRRSFVEKNLDTHQEEASFIGKLFSKSPKATYRDILKKELLSNTELLNARRTPKPLSFTQLKRHIDKRPSISVIEPSVPRSRHRPRSLTFDADTLAEASKKFEQLNLGSSLAPIKPIPSRPS